MLFLVIEHFHPGLSGAVYARYAEKGRMLPEGVQYINSWVTRDLSTCYQVMEAETEEKLREWTACWDDLARFEIIPVIRSAEAREKSGQ